MSKIRLLGVSSYLITAALALMLTVSVVRLSLSEFTSQADMEPQSLALGSGFYSPLDLYSADRVT